MKLLKKKIKTIPFSSTEYLKTKIQVGDKLATIVGFIDEIYPEEKFWNRMKNSEFTIFKFILSNNNGIRIQCNIYDTNIAKFQAAVKMNEV